MHKCKKTCVRHGNWYCKCFTSSAVNRKSKKKLDKRVPHELMKQQMDERETKCSDLLDKHKRKSFLHRIVTCDENGSHTTTAEDLDSS